MSYTLQTINGHEIALLTSSDTIIVDGQTFLDFVMNQPADRIVFYKNNFSESFFDLRSGVAGDILQKAVNYRLQLAIVGDYTRYTSKSLRDFMYESNNGNVVTFVETLDEAFKKLSA